MGDGWRGWRDWEGEEEEVAKEEKLAKPVGLAWGDQAGRARNEFINAASGGGSSPLDMCAANVGEGFLVSGFEERLLVCRGEGGGAG